MWDLGITVNEQPDANLSLQIAEALGNVERRRNLSTEQFSTIVALFEPHREMVEYWLSEFDEETQSWRNYAGYAFDFIPQELFEQVRAMIVGFISMSVIKEEAQAETSVVLQVHSFWLATNAKGSSI